MDDSLTQLIARWQGGDARAGDDLARQVYAQLHAVAVRRLSRDPAAGLQATELVNEAWLKLSARQGDFQSRAHFYAVAALQMRHLLVDLARMREAHKRAGEAVTLTVNLADQRAQAADLAEIAGALDRLADLDPRKAQAFALAELVGFSVPETAQVLSVSVPTAERDLRFARAWLAARMAC